MDIFKKLQKLLVNGKKVTDINSDSVIRVEKGSLSISTNRNNNSSSNNVTLNGAKIIVDGVDYNISDYTTDQVIKVEIQGDVKKVQTASGDVTVNGNVNHVESASGDIHVTGEVNGNLSTMSGDITVQGDIHGNTSTMSGDIKSTKK